MSNEEVILSVQEAAKRIGVAPGTIYKHVAKKIGIRIGRKIVIKEKDLNDYLNTCRIAEAKEVADERSSGV